MVRRIGTLVILLCAFALTGCATVRGAPGRPCESTRTLEQLDSYYAKALLDYYRPGANKIDVRNYFIETRLGIIDAQYLVFKQDLYEEGVSSSFMTDVATLGLNAAGTLTPAASTKSILAAVSGGLIGTRASAEKNFYFERTMAALLSQMEALRKTVRLRIMKGMAMSPDAYPLSQAKTDLTEYYSAGTIAGAIVGMTKAAQEADTDATDNIDDRLSAREIKLKLTSEGVDVRSSGNDEITKILEDFVIPNGRLNERNRVIVKEWLRENRIAEDDVLFFIGSADYAQEKKRAVMFLNQKGFLPK